jgi:gliding motility-associatede transport system auxiliary component
VTRSVALLAAQVLAVASILASLLVIAGRHPVRFDLTPERSLTLSPHTRQVLGRMRAPVTATAFTSGQEQAIRRQIEDLLALVRDAQPSFTVRMLDLDRSPGEAERLGVSNYNVVVLESDGRRERVDPVNEEALVGALLAVGGRADTVAYVLQGHGEPDARDGDGRGGGSDAAATVAADGFDVRPLAGAVRIPPDAGLVVLAGAKRELLPAEVDALDAYVRGGGRLLVLADPAGPRTVAALLERFGIMLEDDVVVDERATLFGADGLSTRVAEVNEELVPDQPVAGALLPVAQTVRLEPRPGMEGAYLAVTDDTSWADTGGRPVATARTFRPAVDRAGPLPIGALVRVAAPDGHEGRVVAIGDADFATNLHLGVLGNRDLLLLAAEVTARGDQALTASRKRPGTSGPFSTLALTAREARSIFWAACVVPATLLAIGAFVVALRRRRTA